MFSPKRTKLHADNPYVIFFHYVWKNLYVMDSYIISVCNVPITYRLRSVCNSICNTRFSCSVWIYEPFLVWGEGNEKLRNVLVTFQRSQRGYYVKTKSNKFDRCFYVESWCQLILQYKSFLYSTIPHILQKTVKKDWNKEKKNFMGFIRCNVYRTVS